MHEVKLEQIIQCLWTFKLFQRPSVGNDFTVNDYKSAVSKFGDFTFQLFLCCLQGGSLFLEI